MNSISGFKPFPLIWKPTQSFEKSTAQTFSKWYLLRQEIETLKQWKPENKFILVTFNFPGIALSRDFVNFKDFACNHSIRFESSPAVWGKFPWKAIQIFRARLVQLVKANMQYASMRFGVNRSWETNTRVVKSKHLFLTQLYPQNNDKKWDI